MAKNTKTVGMAALALTEAKEARTAIVIPTLEVDAETGEPAENVTASLWMGKLDGKEGQYQAAIDGKFGSVAGTGKAALDAALKASNRNPDLYKSPTKVAEFFVSKDDNKEPEPKTMDDLSPTEQDAIRHGAEALAHEYAAIKEASGKTREANRKIAKVFLAVMETLGTKKKQGIFQRYCADKATEPGADAVYKIVANVVSGKNTASEMKFFARLPDELLELMPSGKASPKAAQAWVNGIRKAVSAKIVGVMRRPAGEVEGEEKPSISAIFMQSVNEVKTGLAGEVEGEAMLWLLDAHTKRIGEDAELFTFEEGGKLKAAGEAVLKKLFGEEGSDELLTAVAGDWNSYKTDAEKDADKAEESAVKATAAKLRGFDKFTVPEAAMHLFAILGSRYNLETEEKLAESCDDVAAILNQMMDWHTAIADGTMTLDDVVNPKSAEDQPKDEESAEQAADEE